MRNTRTFLLLRLPVLPLLWILCVHPLPAQIKFDVKTPWAEKYGLTTAKRGVLAAIEASGWGTDVEFGEDYALWLKNLHRTMGGEDTIVLTLDLELRKPSLLSEGELLERRAISLRYHSHTLDSLASLEGMNVLAADYREEGEAWNRLIGTAIGALIPKGKMLVAPILVALLEKINASPKPEEIYEAVLIGTRVVTVLGAMVKEGS